MIRVLLTGVSLAVCLMLTYSTASAQAVERSVGAEAPAAADAELAARIAALSEQGNAAVEAGRGKAGVELYLQAYALDPSQATLLYNIALTYHRVVGDVDLAVSYYGRFLKAPGADPALLGPATQAMVALQEVRKLEREAEAEARRLIEARETADRRDPPVVDGTERPANGPQTPPLGLAEPRADDPPPPSSAPWVLVGVGGTIAVVGGAIGLFTAADHGVFADSDLYDEKRGLADRGRPLGLGADIAVGAGVALALTGLFWWAVADERPAVSAGTGLPAATLTW